MDLNTVVFLGKPGSGKGTQAGLLSQKTCWPVTVSGNLFRALAQESSFAGRKTKIENDQGLLGPDWFAMYFFQDSILSVPEDQGVIFDGFGRKLPEAKNVIDVLTWLERPFRAVHIKVSDEEIRNRLAKRSASSGRLDDTQIEKRLEEYRTYTDPSIELFRQAGVLVEVNGEGAVEDIHADIVTQLGIQ